MNGTQRIGDGHQFAAEEDPKERFYYDYTPQQRNFLFSATALGAICSCLFITQLIAKFGCRCIFTVYGCVSAVSCLLMPAAVRLGFVPMFVLRMVQGSVHPTQFIMISQLTREWAPLRTSGTFLLLLSAHFQLAPVMTMPVSGLLCESQFGWPAIYYLQGAFSLLAFCAFFILFRDTPAQHPCISAKETQSIVRNKCAIIATKEGKKHTLNVPYRQMLTDPIMWIVLFTFWSDELGFLIFTQYGPIYLNRVLGMDVRKTGFLAALPFLLAMMTKFVAGPINDRLPWKSERVRINIFSGISQIGMICAFCALTVLPLVSGIPAWLVQTAYTAVNVFSGLDFLGVIKCSQQFSYPFSSTIMAWESILSSVTTLLLPLAIDLAAPNNRVDEWARILIGIAAFETVTIVLFFLFCDTKPRPWTLHNGNSQSVAPIKDSEANKSDSDLSAVTMLTKAAAAGPEKF